MPNTPVLAAATGLPATRPPLAAIMRRAHDDAREASPRLSYADRFRLALRRAWREAKDVLRRQMRSIVEDRIEFLIAILDHLEPDADLEPSLGSYDASQYVLDSEADDADLEPSLGATFDVDQTGWSQGSMEEADGTLADLRYPLGCHEAIKRETVAVREASARLGAIIADLRGREAAMAVCS